MKTILIFQPVVELYPGKDKHADPAGRRNLHVAVVSKCTLDAPNTT